MWLPLRGAWGKRKRRKIDLRSFIYTDCTHISSRINSQFQIMTVMAWTCHDPSRTSNLVQDSASIRIVADVDHSKKLTQKFFSGKNLEIVGISRSFLLYNKFFAQGNKYFYRKFLRCYKKGFLQYYFLIICKEINRIN